MKRFTKSNYKTKNLSAKQVIAKLRAKSAKKSDEDTKTDDKPVDETPADDSKIDDKPADETPADDSKTDDKPADENKNDDAPEENPEDKEPPAGDLGAVTEALQSLSAKLDLISEGLALVLEQSGLMDSDMSDEDGKGSDEDEEEEDKMDDQETDESDDDEEDDTEGKSDEELESELEATLAELEALND